MHLVKAWHILQVGQEHLILRGNKTRAYKHFMSKKFVSFLCLNLLDSHTLQLSHSCCYLEQMTWLGKLNFNGKAQSSCHYHNTICWTILGSGNIHHHHYVQHCSWGTGRKKWRVGFQKETGQRNHPCHLLQMGFPDRFKCITHCIQCPVQKSLGECDQSSQTNLAHRKGVEQTSHLLKLSLIFISSNILSFADHWNSGGGVVLWNIGLLQNAIAISLSLTTISGLFDVPDMQDKGEIELQCQLDMSTKSKDL